MKILVFHPSLAPYRVDFFNSIDKSFDAKFYFFHENVLDQKFNQESLKQSLSFQCNYLKKGLNILGRPIRFGIKKIIKQHTPDKIICPEYGFITLFIVLLKPFFKKKYKIYTICDDSIAMSIDTKSIRKIFRGYLLKKLDGVILTNNEIANWYKSNLKLKCELLTFPIIIEENKFRLNLKESHIVANTIINQYNLNNKKVILFVGRLVKVKNLHALLKTFNKAKKEDSILVIVGSGDQEESLKLLVNKLKLNSFVIFTGRQEGKTLLAWYAITSVFILPSISEAFGAVINEALISGNYVLCSNLAGARCLIQNNINGCVFDPYNQDAFLNAIKTGLIQVKKTGDEVQIKPSLMQISYQEEVSNLINQLKQ